MPIYTKLEHNVYLCMIRIENNLTTNAAVDVKEPLLLEHEHTFSSHVLYFANSEIESIQRHVQIIRCEPTTYSHLHKLLCDWFVAPCLNWIWLTGQSVYLEWSTRMAFFLSSRSSNMRLMSAILWGSAVPVFSQVCDKNVFSFLNDSRIKSGRYVYTDVKSPTPHIMRACKLPVCRIEWGQSCFFWRARVFLYKG